MSILGQDLRFAVRTFAQQPALTATALVTLALGIGANTAMFSLVDSVLLTPPPFRQPERLVAAYASAPELARMSGIPDKLPVSNGDFYEWERRSHSFSHLAYFGPDAMTLSGVGEPEQLNVVRATGDFSAALGTPPILGRGLVPADDVPDHPSALLLSYSFWQRHFGGDRRIVGRKAYLNREPVTIVGVMPERFAFPRATEITDGFGFSAEPDGWVPFSLSLAARQNHGARLGFVIGRLRPGASVGSAEKEMKAISAQLNGEFPSNYNHWSARLVPLAEQRVGSVRPALLRLWAAVGLVLLIACANVANLLLARAAARQKEVAVRTALGASRGRLVRQLLTESGLLAALGGSLGAGLAALGLRAMAAFVPAELAQGTSFALDPRMLGWTFLLGGATCLLTGLAPAFQTLPKDLARTLRERRGGTGVRRGTRGTRGALVVAEVALALLLLLGAGLLLRSYSRLLAVDPGFRPARALAFEIQLPRASVPAAARRQFFDRVIRRLRALPGTVEAGAVNYLPLGGGENVNGWEVEGRPARQVADLVTGDFRIASPGYFTTMGIPLHRGRRFTSGDEASTLPVAVIDDGMARTQWPGQDPIGKRFRHQYLSKDGSQSPWLTVIGVVGTVRHSNLETEPRAQIYQPLAQAPVPSREMTFVLRSRGEPGALATAARAAVRELDPNLAIADVRTLERAVTDSVAPRRFTLLLFGLFGALALALSAVGIYGLLAYSVVQRTPELGLRMALGAQPRQVLGLLLAEAGTLVGAGLVLGLGAALALSRAMASLLYGVGSTDPTTFAAVALFLAFVALLAAWLPGRRATRLSPTVALRDE